MTTYRRRTVLTGLFTLALALGAHAAHAQRPPSDWVRTGTFATREAALAPNIQVEYEPVLLDPEHDGLPDQLVILSEGSSYQPALARHTAAGWTLVLIGTDTMGSLSWSQSVALPGGVAAVLVWEGRGDGRDNGHTANVYWFAPGAAPAEASDDLGDVTASQFAALPDGSLRECDGGRCRSLRWNAAHTRVAPGSWAGSRRGTPPAIPAAGVASAAPAPAAACTARPSASFHLRATEALASSGPELPAGTALTVLSPGALTRGATRIYRVRVASGAEGFVFLAPAELDARCPR